MLHSYLQRAEECIEEVQKMPPQKFNNHQCDYLADKLRLVVESARSFLVLCGAKCHGPGSSEDMARSIEIFKLLVALAQEIESFIQGCCKGAWIQAAMTLTNVSEYISSLGFNLELCRVALQSKECAASGILTLDQVADIHKDEVEVVKTKSSTDWDALVARVIHSLTDKSLSTEENDLAAYLLQRLHKVKPILQPASSGSSWRSIIDDDGSVLGNLYKWVKPLERLGKGATGTVYRALWLGTPVAKKTFSGRNNADFKREVEILGGLSHPNITSMFCCAEHTRSCSIIMELMDEDLHELMQKRCEQRFDGNSECPPFTILEGVDMMLQVSEGVNYLHKPSDVKPSIVHRDLKSSNILIKQLSGTELESGYVHAKVTDFGLCKTKESSTRYSHQTWNTGTHKWMAPEVINLDPGSQTNNLLRMPRYPHKCDVYSFAMVCYEILTGDEPFPNTSPNYVKMMVKKGQRPDLPDHCPYRLKVLIQKCWHQDPTMRPSFEVICTELKYLKYLLMMGFSSNQDLHLSAAPAAGAPAGTGDGYGQAASNLVAGSVIDMGYGSWDRDTALRALRADSNNPERAVEYLNSGTPEAAEVPAPVARAPPAAAPAAAVPAAPAPAAPAAPQGPNAAPLDLFPQGMPGVGGGGAGLGALGFLRTNPQFLALRSMVQANPQILKPMLQELGKQNPALLRLINDNQAEFLRLINEASAEGGEGGDAMGQLAGAYPQSVNVTPEERESIERGIPEVAEEPAPVAHAPPTAAPAAAIPAAPAPAAPAAPQGPNAAPLDLFPQGMPGVGGGGAGFGALDFLRTNPQFLALRSMVQANPQILQPMLQELGRQNRAILMLINDNQAEFLRLINEASAEGGEGGDAMGQLAGAYPRSTNVTPEERESIERLEAMGFNRSLVIEAFLASDKNEQLAANYLLEHAGDYDEL